MSSRLNILNKIKGNKPALVDLPIVDSNLFYEEQNNLEVFSSSVALVGGSSYQVESDKDILKKVNALYPNALKKYSCLDASHSFNTIQIDNSVLPNEFEDLDVLVLEGAFGVAENGAIWLCDAQIPIRVLPFITKNLVLVLNENNIVINMHQAYDKIAKSNEEFGVFISGPSKTADIEQALVIGAQGALSLHVFIKKT